MAGGKLPPRQKMIGLMYLVLLALLAMNVSKSILESFVIINDGIETTAETFVASNENLYSAFDKAAQESPAAKAWQTKAEKVKKSANELVAHIDVVKRRMYKNIDGLGDEGLDTLKLADISAKDNYDEPSRLMGIGDPGAPGAAPDCEECSSTLLKEKINTYQTGLLALFEDKEIKAEIAEKIDFLSTNEIEAHDGTKPWEVGMFYHNPLAAVVTTLSKIQSDVRTAEAQVINRLYENIDAGGVSFNKVVGMAVLPKAFLTPADSFSADIFTAAYDDRVNPEVYVFNGPNGGIDSAALANNVTDIDKLMKGTKGTKWGDGDWYQMSEEDVKAGKGNLKIKPSMGVNDWGGLIKLKTKKGPKVYDFKSSFEVASPSSGAVSADAMNVFYMGIDNPVTVSAPMSKFTASAPGLSKSGKGWVMKPRSTKDVNIVVTGEDEVTGQKIKVGSFPFRVKRIPTPVAYIAGKTGTIVLSKREFGDGVIQAKLEGFVFDLRVKVKSFELITTVNGDVKTVKVSGNRMNSKAKDYVKRGSRGQRFYLENMAVKMPDGRTVTMGNVTVKIK
ncbi:MAG: gliding motility protein GldM [Vicingaceae bacterium]|nr:gliding motility protein GldM [Vicingaceae bacterium]